MADVTTENRQIARRLASVFSGAPQVNRYWDEARKSHVDLISSSDRPYEGVVSYGTIGLSDHPLIQEEKEFPVRLELLGVSRDVYGEFPRMLTTAAFCVINDLWFCSPGSILRNAVDMYDSSLSMKHFMFVSSFLWEGLEKMEFESKSIVWLLAVPISENERVYAEKNGTDALEDLFEKEQIDVFDLGRSSVL